MTNPWYTVTNPDSISSPGLLLYRERMEANLQRMIEMVPSVEQLRPHVKTHKSPEIIRMQMDAGIHKFKVATIAEAEMVAGCGECSILVAYPLVGPNIGRFLNLMQQYPQCEWLACGDDLSALQVLGTAAKESGREVEVLVDIDCGMHRTGVAADQRGFALYQQVAKTNGLRCGGLHVYDGHLHLPDFAERETASEFAMREPLGLQQRLVDAGLPVPRLVCGGSPTFPIHAKHSNRECSPGTTVLWDAGYGSKMPDLPFEPAAALLTRLISKPASGRLCLDAGNKAVASEHQNPRLIFPQIPDATIVMHSEEHLVLETSIAEQTPVGSVFYGIPWHICPTCNLYSQATIIEHQEIANTWTLPARERMISL